MNDKIFVQLTSGTTDEYDSRFLYESVMDDERQSLTVVYRREGDERWVRVVYPYSNIVSITYVTTDRPKL